MHRSPRMLFAFVLGFGLVAAQPALHLVAAPAPGQSQQASLQPVAAISADIPFHADEYQTEQQLLTLANQARRQVGVPALKVDAGLSNAARMHAMSMLEARQLSHQFRGEPALPQRLAATSPLILDHAGENVALDYDAQHGHEHLMLSPPHRANLLNPAYNVVGLGVVRGGDRLYIVQDFGHALPTYTATEVKDRVTAALIQKRHQARRSQLPRRDLAEADGAACSMAQADRLGTTPVLQLAERSTVLTYTTLHPEMLPSQTLRAIGSRNLRSFSVGSCFSRTATYPTGVYWVVLALE